MDNVILGIILVAAFAICVFGVFVHKHHENKEENI